MTTIIPTLAVVFGAFCVWLAVRIVNRRERWAKWTLAVIVGLPVLYVASFGPACWFTSRTGFAVGAIPKIYRPIIAAMAGPEYPDSRRMLAGLHGGRIYSYPPKGLIERYSRLVSASGWSFRRWADFGWQNDQMEQLTDDVWEWADSTK